MIVKPALKDARLDKPVAMLLFGMLNWMFTWLRPEGRLTHATIAPLVCELFFNGLSGLGASGGKQAARAPAKARSRAAAPPRI